jgi:hypothetical protein
MLVRILIVTSYFLISCTQITYKALPDGSTTVTINAIGNIDELSNATMGMKMPNGSERNFSLNGLAHDNQKGLEVIPGIVESAVTGAVKGMK